MSKNWLDLDDANRQAIEALIARASAFKRGVPNAARILDGKIVLGMFFEKSTRTVTSFAIAAQKLGAMWLNFDPESSSLGKGETLEDTMRTIRALGGDAVVVRHQEAGFPHALARYFAGSVINAGDGAHAHPTQGLLDAMTLVEEFGDLTGRRLVIAGDIKHSRVARSAARAAHLLGADVTLCAPPMLLPPSDPAWGFARTSTDLDACIGDADAIMLLRIQRERSDSAGMPPADDLADQYGLTEERAARLPDHAIIMHPGPTNRGVEIAHALVASPRSRIERQVTNGTFVRMAVLEDAIGGKA